MSRAQQLLPEEKQSESRPAPGANSRYKWSVVWMLWFVCFFNYADRQAIFAVFPVLKKEFQFDPVQLGWIASSFMWVYAFGAPVAGMMSDKFRRKNLILGGCLFWSVITAMTGWCHKLWHFITIRALEGLGETLYFPSSLSLLGDYHGPETRSRAFSLHQSSVYLGTIAGSWAGAWFAEKHGWRSGFYFFGVTGTVLALALFRFLREPSRQTPAPTPARANSEKLLDFHWSQAMALAFRKPAALLLMGAFVAANFVAAIFLAWTPTFLVEKFHFNLTHAGLSGTIFIHFASFLSVSLGGYLADKLFLKFSGGRILVQAIGLFLGSGFVFLLGWTEEVNTLLVAMAGFGFCKGLYDANIFASLFDFLDPRIRGSMAGMMNTVGWAGGALGPLAVGVATKHGGGATPMDNMSLAIRGCALIYLFAAFLLFLACMNASRSRQ